MRVQADVEKLRASAAALRLLNDDLAPTLLKLEVGNVVLELVDFFVDSRLINELDALVDAIRTRGRRLTAEGESLATRLTAFAERLEAADGRYMLSLANGSLSESERALLPQAMDKERLFNKEHLDEIANTNIPGTNSSELNQAMETLIDPKASKAEIAAAIKTIAEKCEISEAEAAANYKRLRDLLDKQSPPPDKIDLNRHPKFLGSQPNLLFGKVVGDALGMHPAFAALLSPTGGIAGGGNDAVGEIYWENHPIGYHAATHDAAGYLKKYHDLGPGYDYLGQEGHRNQSHHFTGQESGIKYWAERMNGYETRLHTAINNSTPDFLSDRGVRIPKQLNEADEEKLLISGGYGLGESIPLEEKYQEVKDTLNATDRAIREGANYAANEARRVTTEALNKARAAFSF